MILQNFGQSDTTSAQPLSNTLFSKLQADILTGVIRSGEKLTEQKLCNQYKVSRTPVREALRQLEMDGLIENIPNRGAFVIGFTPQDIEDMYELRSVYEVQAVKWAIMRITETEFDQLEETFEFMEFYTMKKDWEKMLNINNRFHNQIYNAAHNRMLLHMLSSYQLYLSYLRKKPLVTDDAYLADVLGEHRNIFEAFKTKDVDAGCRAMAVHMSNTRIRFTE